MHSEQSGTQRLLEEQQRRIEKDGLRATAETILRELSGPAGLLMDFETRTGLLRLCDLWDRYDRRQNVSIEQLVYAFYQARRQLRGELRMPENIDIAEAVAARNADLVRSDDPLASPDA